MHTSDWIALAACVAAFLALIPAFVPLITKAKPRKNAQEDESSPSVAEEGGATPSAPAPPLNNFGTALALTSLALIVGVVEIVLFSAVANFFGISVDIKSMPTNWLVVYYALFFLPGLLLFRAFLSITNMFY